MIAEKRKLFFFLFLFFLWGLHQLSEHTIPCEVCKRTVLTHEMGNQGHFAEWTGHETHVHSYGRI